MKKSMLKLTLAALALTAGAFAFAEGETEPAVVQLSNGAGSVSWTDFVNALNGNIKADIATLSNTNPAKQAYNAANTKLNAAAADSLSYVNGTSAANTTVKNAQAYADSFDPDNADAYANNPFVVALGDSLTDMNTKKTALETAQGTNTTALNTTLTEAQAALTTAKKDSSDYVAGLEKAYNDAQAELATKKENLATLETQRTEYRSDSTNLEDKIHSAEQTVATLQGQLAVLPKKTEKGPAPWLTTIIADAKAFWGSYKDNSKAEDAPTVYYKYTNAVPEGGDDWDPKVTTFTIAFTEPTTTGWTGPVKQSTLRTWFGTLNSSGIKQFDKVYVYMGSDYEKKTGSDTYIFGQNVAYGVTMLQNIYEALSSLTGDARFLVDIVSDEYQNPTAAQNLENQISTAETNIANLKKQLWGIHKDADGKLPEGVTEEVDGVADQLKAVRQQISTTNGDIKTLNDTTIPNALSKWNAAKDGTLTDKAFTDLKDAITTAQTNVNNAQTALDNAETAIANAQKAYDDAVAAYAGAQNTLKTEGEKAAQALTDAKDALEKAQAASFAAYGEAYEAFLLAQETAQEAANEQALKNYQRVTLTADVTASTTIKNAYSGTIIGGDHIITSTVSPLFDEFTGTVSAAAINLPASGKFATISAGAKFYHVASWDGVSAGRYYGEDGILKTCSTLGVLGYNNRAEFGVDWTANKLVAKTDATTVYSVTVNNSAADNAPYYVTINGGKMATDDNAAVTIPANRFAKCADDLKTFSGALPANLYYGSNNDCASAVIEDKVDFYCPVNVNAAKVTYNRAFNAGKFNSVCLPFAVQSTDDFTVYTYDSNKGTKDGQFWFTLTSGEVPANTPMLITPEAGVNAITIEGETATTIMASPAKKFVEVTSVNGGVSFGTLKKTNASEMLGESQKDHIFGLTTKDGVQVFTTASTAENGGAAFPAFRMAIKSDYTAAQNPAPRKICIQDEDGNDITDQETTGISNVEAEATSLAVTTAQGQIIFTSEADYGTVQVYGIDGRVAANATVMAGTTAIDVPAGMYIVLGKKVLVK